MSQKILKGGAFSTELALSFRQAFRLLLTRLLPAYIRDNDLVRELRFDPDALSEILSWTILSMDRKDLLKVEIDICSIESVFNCSVFPFDEDYQKPLVRVSLEEGLDFFRKKLESFSEKEQAKSANA